jgi:serine/threonine protein kinase
VTALLAGRYRLERPLGHGGMAVVVLARDVELDRTVAVKLLAENLARDDGVRVRFLREARLSGRLAHPNVVRVFDVGERPRPFIVMEYVDGGTIASLLRRERRLAPAAAVDIARQACDGLAAAHAIGLVHRDVKPQNLLVGRDGVVKVADFGIARLEGATQLTQTGTLLGTAAYVAPEQARGEPAGPAVDLYALGAVLYELLTGRQPRQATTLAELASRLDEPVTPLRELVPDVPAALEALVMRCLAAVPGERPSSAAGLARELAALDGEAPTEPLLPTRTHRLPARTHGRRSRRPLPAATVAASSRAEGTTRGARPARPLRPSTRFPPPPTRLVRRATSPPGCARTLASARPAPTPAQAGRAPRRRRT